MASKKSLKFVPDEEVEVVDLILDKRVGAKGVDVVGVKHNPMLDTLDAVIDENVEDMLVEELALIKEKAYVIAGYVIIASSTSSTSSLTSSSIINIITNIITNIIIVTKTKQNSLRNLTV